MYPEYLALDRRNPLEKIRALPLATANETFVLIPFYFLIEFYINDNHFNQKGNDTAKICDIFTEDGS